MKASYIRHKINDYIYLATRKLYLWLQSRLPKPIEDSWNDYIGYLSKKNVVCPKSSNLKDLDLYYLLWFAQCKMKDISEVYGDVYNYLPEKSDSLQKMREVRNFWAHLSSELPTALSVIDDLDVISRFFCLFDDSKNVIDDIDVLKGKIENSGIEDDSEALISEEEEVINKNTNSDSSISSEMNAVQENLIVSTIQDEKQSVNQLTEEKEKFEDNFYHNEEYIKPSSGLKIESTAAGATVVGMGSCTDTVIVIPLKYKNKPVTRIADGAFLGHSEIEGVVIPEGVHYIGSKAFSVCTSLKKIFIPASVESIGVDAFRDCICLKDIFINSLASWCSIKFKVEEDENGQTIPYSNPLTYAGTLYIDDEAVEELNFDDDIDSIESYAFYNCKSIHDVCLGCSVNKIKTSSFEGCSSLKNIILPQEITSIGIAAFRDCKSLVSINIPENVSYIGKGAFLGCTGLERIYYNAVAIDETAEDFALDETVFALAGDAKDGIDVTIGKLVTKIPSKLFKSIYIKDTHPENSIINIKSVTFEDECVCSSIGTDAFSGCIYLSYINIPESIVTIEEGAFKNCLSLKQINIPESVRLIGNCAFRNCGLVKVHIKDGVKTIGEAVFSKCSALQEIVIPNTVTSLGIRAFMKCIALRKIIISEGLSFIPSFMLKECTSLRKVIIPNGVNEIGEEAFYGCRSLFNVRIPADVTLIGRGAFSRCSSFTEITIPENVIYIGEEAFGYCYKAERIFYNAIEARCDPDSVFQSSGLNGDGITAIIGSKVKIIPGYLFSTLFQELYLKKVIFKEGSQCTCIEEGAFSECTALESIEIPQSVITIGEYAFLDDISLSNINIPNGVTSIREKTFDSCSSLTSVSLPETISNIGKFAFNECTSLTSIHIPGRVSFIGEGAFYNCTALREIYYEATEADDILFSDDTRCSVFYNAGQEGEGIDITIGENVKKIPARLFSVDMFIDPDPQCGFCNVKNVLFKGNSKCINIGEDAFCECRRLRNISIPPSVAYIGASAFADCTSLDSILICANTEIAPDAFDYCTSLKYIFFYGDEKEWTEFCFHPSYVKSFENVKVFLYSDTKPKYGDFWHYVDGKPIPW